ncbi:MAG: DUF4405 domain-containing protein [Gammaproteobacteria bacterium]|nr:DUF4405 domain-containing protein [Gammaproteobacteria bacterium]
MVKNKQSIRSLIAFLVTWAFLVLTVTGIILYIVPQGRIAYWTHWSLAGLDKEQWGWIHMMFGGIFIVTGALHLYYNWKPFKKYLSERVKGELNLSRELVASLLLTVIMIVLSIYNLPPASWIFALNDSIKNSWVTSPELEPPFGHAEEISLKGIAKRMRLNLDGAIKELKQNNIHFDPSESLDTIARNNNTTPMVIYSHISKHKEQAVPASSKQWTPEGIEAEFSGSGLGRKSIAELCEVAGVNLETCLSRLNNAGIKATATDGVRDLSTAHDRNPVDLLKIILIPEK